MRSKVCFVSGLVLLTSILLISIILYDVQTQHGLIHKQVIVGDPPMVQAMVSDPPMVQATVTDFPMVQARVSDPLLVQAIVSDRQQKKLRFVGKKINVSDNCTKEFPNAIIIGVMKGGTEAFSTFLGIHPQVAMQFQMRSTLYFSYNFGNSLSWYKDKMPCRSADEITVEKSPQYWSNPDTPRRIYKFNKHMKLMIIVRNPIDRSVSHFLQQNHSNPQLLHGKTFEKNILNKKGNIDASCDFVHVSQYSVVLKNWLKYFSMEQVLIIDGDNFRNNPAKELAKAEKFLGIEPYIREDLFEVNLDRNVSCIKHSFGKPACLPFGKGRTHPDISSSVYIKLKAYFNPYNQDFFKMTQTYFDW